MPSDAKRREFLTMIGVGALFSHLLPKSSMARSENAGATGTDTTTATSSGELLWEFTATSGPIWSSPSVVDGTAYFSTDVADSGVVDERDFLYAVDAATGDREWAVGESIPAVGASSPTVVDGSVYFAPSSPHPSWPHLYSVDANSGEQEWVFDHPGSPQTIFSSPTVVGGSVYVGSSDGRLHAVDAATGNEEWTFTEPEDSTNSSPTVVDETVYVGSSAGTLYAVDADTGEQKWAVTEPRNEVVSSPTVVDDTVYVGSDTSVYAVDSETGEQVWAFTDPLDAVHSSPTVYQGTVYVGSNEGTLYAADRATGEQEWAFSVPDSRLESSPTVVDDTVFIGSLGDRVDRNGSLHAVDVTTGKQEWVFTEIQGVFSSPVVIEDIVYVGSLDGTLYALDAGITGSSEGSQVTLGTLGHHDKWAQRAGSGFDPAVHGFGFANWRTGESPEGDEFEVLYPDPQLDELRNRSRESDLFDTAGQSGAAARIAYTSASWLASTNGHCYGMVKAADEYYQHPEELPEPADTASDVHTPVDNFEAVGEKIRYYQTQQLTPDTFLQNVALQLGAIDERASLQAIVDDIDRTGTAIVGLYDSSPLIGAGHQVLAYGYEEIPEFVEIFLYDPNAPAPVYEDREEVIVVNRETGAAEALPEPYDRYAHYESESCGEV